jgi:hypothetical protein
MPFDYSLLPTKITRGRCKNMYVKNDHSSVFPLLVVLLDIALCLSALFFFWIAGESRQDQKIGTGCKKGKRFKNDKKN